MRTTNNSFTAFKKTMAVNLAEITKLADYYFDKSSEIKLFRELVKKCLVAPTAKKFEFKKNVEKNNLMLLNAPLNTRQFDEIMYQTEGTVDYYMSRCDDWNPWERNSVRGIKILIAYYNANFLFHGAIIETLFQNLEKKSIKAEKINAKALLAKK